MACANLRAELHSFQASNTYKTKSKMKCFPGNVVKYPPHLQLSSKHGVSKEFIKYGWLQKTRYAPSIGCSAAQQQDTSTLEAAKAALRASIEGSRRGCDAAVRPEVAEKQVAVEAFGREWSTESLAGDWRLVYTTAQDVLQIYNLEDTGLVQVGDVEQNFRGGSEMSLENVVHLSTPLGLLQPAIQGARTGGVTLRVGQRWERRGPRTITVQFLEAKLGEVQVSDLVQQLIAPALLPRTFLNMQLLMFIKDLNLKIPLTRSSDKPSMSDGLTYHLTYLDEDMLIGRASGSGGTFIFEKAAEKTID